MNLKKLFFTIMLLMAYTTVVHPAAAPMNQNMALTQEGEEIMKAAMQELAQAWEKWTPEEQEQFLKVYEEMSQLPQEELSKMVNEQYGVPVFVPAEQGMSAAEYPAQEMPVEPVQPAEREVTQPKTPSSESKQKQATALLNSIIERINSFLHKTQIMPEFTGKLKKWTEQGKIKGWHPELQWNTVKKDIDSLVHTLEKISETGKKTKTFKFLDDLIANESAYNNLNKLNVSLTTHEPAIYIEELGFEPMSKESRKSMRTVIATLLEALYTLSIPQELNAVIEKYEPIAKKSREQEEAATKKAIEESKRERFGRPGITAGYGEESEPYYGGSTGNFEPYGGSYGGGNYGGGYAPYSGGYEPMTEQPQQERGTQKDSGGAEKPKTPSASEGSDKEKGKEDSAIERIVRKVDSSIDQAATEISAENARLHDIYAHLLDSGAPDANTAGNSLPRAIKFTKEAADNIERLKRKVGKAKSKSKDEVKELYEEHKKKFDNVLKQIRQAKGSLGQISTKKKEAFWGQAPVAAPAVPTQKQKAEGEAPATEPTKPAGRSLLELEKAIEDLQSAMSGL